MPNAIKKCDRDWKAPFFEGTCPTQIDWARMAAYIDGEGSILINTQKRGTAITIGYYLRITVANTDVRLMQWLKETFGGTFKNANTAKYYIGKNYKQCYHWGTSAHRAAWILHNCLELFIIKRDQAELGLQLQVSMSRFRNGRLGKNKELPTELRQERAEIKAKLLVLKARGINPLVSQSIPLERSSEEIA